MQPPRAAAGRNARHRPAGEIDDRHVLRRAVGGINLRPVRADVDSPRPGADVFNRPRQRAFRDVDDRDRARPAERDIHLSPVRGKHSSHRPRHCRALSLRKDDRSRDYVLRGVDDADGRGSLVGDERGRPVFREHDGARPRGCLHPPDTFSVAVSTANTSLSASHVT